MAEVTEKEKAAKSVNKAAMSRGEAITGILSTGLGALLFLVAFNLHGTELLLAVYVGGLLIGGLK